MIHYTTHDLLRYKKAGPYRQRDAGLMLQLEIARLGIQVDAALIRDVLETADPRLDGTSIHPSDLKIVRELLAAHVYARINNAIK